MKVGDKVSVYCIKTVYMIDDRDTRPRFLAGKQYNGMCTKFNNEPRFIFISEIEEEHYWIPPPDSCFLEHFSMSDPKVRLEEGDVNIYDIMS